MKTLAILNIIIFFIATDVICQDSQLLKSLQTKYNSIEDITASFSQSSANSPSFTPGKFYYKKGDKIRIELKNLVLISDRKTTWNYSAKKNKVIISNYDEGDPFMFSLDKFIYDYPSKCDISEGTDAAYRTLILKAKNTKLNFKEVVLWVSEKSIVNKIKIVDQNDQQTVIEFFNVKLNRNLPDSKFTFTPSKEVQVIDLR